MGTNFGMGGMRNRGCVASRQHGQALVEFSLVAPLFFFLLMFALSAGFYTLERAGAVNATTAGARIAASAQAGDVNQPALLEARTEAARELSSSLPGTRVVLGPSFTRPCPPLADIPPATVLVCVNSTGPDSVRVEVVGHPATIASAVAGGLAVPIDIYAEVHTAVFKP